MLNHPDVIKIERALYRKFASIFGTAKSPIASIEAYVQLHRVKDKAINNLLHWFNVGKDPEVAIQRYVQDLRNELRTMQFREILHKNKVASAKPYRWENGEALYNGDPIQGRGTSNELAAIDEMKQLVFDCQAMEDFPDMSK